jgi:hypothetical protein
MGEGKGTSFNPRKCEEINESGTLKRGEIGKYILVFYFAGCCGM